MKISDKIRNTCARLAQPRGQTTQGQTAPGPHIPGKTQYLNPKAAAWAGVPPGHYRIGPLEREDPVTVPPMEWREFPGPKGSPVSRIFRVQDWGDDNALQGVSYTIFDARGRFTLVLKESADGEPKFIGDFGTLTTAQRAAEYDFEAHHAKPADDRRTA